MYLHQYINYYGFQTVVKVAELVSALKFYSTAICEVSKISTVRYQISPPRLKVFADSRPVPSVSRTSRAVRLAV